jgi:L-alanine-DL-glutamate epimerase-like enolase superfamily enzyme
VTNVRLFPGGRPGGPLTSSQLLRRMTALGIQARPARNGTLMDLAAQLPAVVLARLLGVAVPTATRWTGVADRSTSQVRGGPATRTNERGACRTE